MQGLIFSHFLCHLSPGAAVRPSKHAACRSALARPAARAYSDLIDTHPRGFIMKKSATFVIVFLCALLLWNVFAWHGNVNIDGDDFDGPFGALLATVFAGGGILLAGAIVMMVFGILAAVFAGVGLLCIGGLALGALVLALVIAPFLLPLLVPVAIVWYLASRSRRQRIIA
jgi:hypothetical protein